MSKSILFLREWLSNLVYDDWVRIYDLEAAPFTDR